MTALASVARVVIEANGVELAEVAQTITAVRVQQRLSLPAQCELTFSATRDSLEVASVKFLNAMANRAHARISHLELAKAS